MAFYPFLAPRLPDAYLAAAWIGAILQYGGRTLFEFFIFLYYYLNFKFPLFKYGRQCAIFKCNLTVSNMAESAQFLNLLLLLVDSNPLFNGRNKDLSTLG